MAYSKNEKKLQIYLNKIKNDIKPSSRKTKGDRSKQ